MNIEQANTIPMSVILEKLNLHPAKQTEKSAWYLSPFRQEKTASFHVLKETNSWHDFGEDAGGDVVDFVVAHLKTSNVNYSQSDALRWIDNMTGQNPAQEFIPCEVPKAGETDKTLELKSVKQLKHAGLIHYLENRGIDIELAKKHLKEAYIENSNTGNRFYALALKNEENGYELRNPLFKSCVRKKHITFIRGTIPKPDGIHIFEGMMDYLTYLTIKKYHENDVIILNSLSCLKYATGYIKGYGYKIAYTWLDNDKAGKKATELLAAFFQTEENLTHKPMNKVYAECKDMNAWHMHNLNLALV